jgi:hypothetical protein
MKSYKSLNDARVIHPGLASGETHVWYMKPAYIPRFMLGLAAVRPTSLIPTDPKRLGRTHIWLGKIASVDPEEVFRILQGDVWSPTGEARDLIIGKRLHHTSMSVGDCVVRDGQIYMVDNVGFRATKDFLEAFQ